MSHPHGSTDHSHGRRRTVRSTVAALAAFAALAGCTRTESGLDSGVSTPTVSPEANTEDPTTTTTVAKKGGSSEGVSWELPRSTQYGTVIFTVESAERLATLKEDGVDTDEETDNLVVNLGLENLAQNADWSFPSGVFHLETADGTRYDAFQGPSKKDPSVQMGGTSTGEVMFEVDSGADLEGATFFIQGSEDHPAAIPLDGDYEFEPPEPVSVPVSPTQFEDANGTPICALGNMGNTNDWELSDIQAFASRDMVLTPAESPGGAGLLTGRNDRAREGHVFLTIRMKVSDYARNSGANGCTPGLKIDADGLTTTSEAWNLSKDTSYTTTSSSTNLIQHTYEIPVGATSLTANFENPEGLSLNVDPSFLEQFQD